MGGKKDNRHEFMSEQVKKWGGRGDFILIYPIAKTEYPNVAPTEEMVDITIMTNCSAEVVAKVTGQIASRVVVNTDPSVTVVKPPEETSH